MPLCRAGEISALWKAGGLENVRGQSIDIQMKFESFMDYWNPSVLGQGPAGAYVRRLDRSKLQTLRSDVKRRLSLSTENAPFVLPGRVWSVGGVVPSHR
jgi:hypothetical protein